MIPCYSHLQRLPQFGPLYWVLLPDLGKCQHDQNAIIDYVGIRARVSVFPRHTRVRRLPMTVDGKLYLVYFDRERHKTDRAKATYVFLRLKHKGAAMDFSIELHFLDIMRMLSLSVLYLFSWLPN